MPYRIALLVDDLRVSKSVRDLAQWAKLHAGIELVALIAHPAPQTTVKGFAKFRLLARTQGLYTAISRSAFAAMVMVESKLLLRNPVYREHLCLHDITDMAATRLVTEPIVSPSGFVYRFSDIDLEKVRALDLHALIRCGNGILKGEILTGARDGVISMHHADNRINRGGPAAFWEVLEGRAQTGFIIQRLTEELDGGDVLFRGSIATDLFYTRNQFNLAERANTYVQLVIQRLSLGQLTPEPPHVYDRHMYRTPLLHNSLRYALLTLSRLTRKALRRAMGKKWHWGVAYSFQPWCSAVLWRSKILPAPKGSFIADPFVIEVDGSHYVFVEEYPYNTCKGVISAYRIDRTGPQRIGVALEEPWHLSFPWVFRRDGNIYMVPEGGLDRSIRLYKAEHFPDHWSLCKVLMTDVTAADTMIFEHGERWWMFTTICGEGGAANDAELCVFYASEPEGEWTPHELNPVVMDANKGRNGGLLRDEEGSCYRIGQRHVFTRYGAGFSIYRIDELTPTTYAETLMQDVEPTFFEGIVGTHHFHADDGLAVIDFCRNERPR